MSDEETIILTQNEKIRAFFFKNNRMIILLFLLFLLFMTIEILELIKMNFYAETIIEELNWINSSILFLLFGFLGFIYLFIVPGTIFLIKQGYSISIENVILGTTIGVALLTLSVLYIQLFSFPLNRTVVLLLPLFNVIISFLIPRGSFPNLSFSGKRIERTRIFFLALIICFIAFFLIIIIRLGGFCYQIFPYSDSIHYTRMIEEIATGTYFFNEDRKTWAPLFQILSTMFLPFVGNEFISLKVVSFLFNLLIPFVGTILFVYLNSHMQIKDWQLPIVFILFMMFPWVTVLATVALQDSVLAFTTISAVLYLVLAIKNDFKSGFLFMAGVFLSSSFLLRYSSALVIIAITLLLFGIIYLKMGKIVSIFLRKALFYVIGGVITVIPWFFRNQLLFGQFLVSKDFGLFALPHILTQYGTIIWRFVLMDRGFLGWQILIYIAIVLIYSFKKQELDLTLYGIIIMSASGLIPLFFFHSLQIRFWMPVLIVVPLFMALGTNHKNFIGPLIPLSAFFILSSARDLSQFWFVVSSATIKPEDWNYPILYEFDISVIDPIFLIFVFLGIFLTYIPIIFIKNSEFIKNLIKNSILFHRNP